MRILVVGAGGVGAAIASIAERRAFFDEMVLADVDLGRAERMAMHLSRPHPERPYEETGGEAR